MNGETKYTDARLEESGRKCSIRQKERWENYTQEKKDEIIDRLTLGCNKRKKNTKIEIIVKDTLEKMGVIFYNNYPSNRFVFDFYLPDYNFVIECQGDYWHGNPEYFPVMNYIQIANIARDKNKKNYLDNNLFNYFFMWENEIYKNKKNLDIILWQHLNQIPKKQ